MNIGFTDTPPTVSLGTRLRRLRQVRAWSQTDIARRARLSKAFVSQLESERSTNPSLSALRRLADALEVRLEWLVSGELQPGETWERRAAIESLLKALADHPEIPIRVAEALMQAARGPAPFTTAQDWRKLIINWRLLRLDKSPVDVQEALTDVSGVSAAMVSGVQASVRPNVRTRWKKPPRDGSIRREKTHPVIAKAEPPDRENPPAKTRDPGTSPTKETTEWMPAPRPRGKQKGLEN